MTERVFLDCGCCIEDRKRIFCPSCANDNSALMRGKYFELLKAAKAVVREWKLYLDLENIFYKDIPSSIIRLRDSILKVEGKQK